MAIRVVQEDLFAYLLNRVTGQRFETFAKGLFGIVFGESFIPLGGIHDGGADGALSSYLQEVKGKSNTFVQFTITAETGVRTKVLQTIKALSETGRSVRQIIYATNQALPKFDVLAQEMFDKHEVMLQLRDYERIRGYVNSDDKCNTLFYDFFASEISALARAANSNLTSVNEFASDPTVYVCLNYELKNKHVKNHLNEQVLDALIYWALRDTDPDAGKIISRASIHDSIMSLFPQARSVLLPKLNGRLLELAKKVGGGLERLRFYKVKDSFCLPYEMRTALATEASAALARQARFRQSITSRLEGELGSISNANHKAACNALVFLTVHRYFIEQGVLLAAFLEGRLDAMHISDQVVEDIMVDVLSQVEHSKSISPDMFGACLSALRGIFYHPTAEEREYMAYLSKTSCLLVTLQSAPKLLEYFNKMGGNFRLIVGTDLIVKAISERYVEENNKQVSKILQVSKQLGSELILAEPVLDEVFTHLHATDLEFRNHYAEQEKYLRSDLVVDSDRIMIRAYFHARRSAGGPKTWAQFIEQVVTHSALRSKAESARQDLKAFLVQKFGMKFVSSVDLSTSVNLEMVKQTAAKLDEARKSKHEDLAYNDALMAYATYAQRKRNEESAIYDGFGFRTWWLTKETYVVNFTKALVESEGGVPYIMRPEFILNFISLAASADNVRRSFADLLPTTAGLQLGRHLPSTVMHQMMGDAEEWGDKPAERISTLITEKANKLKHDQFKQYIDNIE